MKIRTGQIEFAGKVPLNTSGNKNAFSFSKDKRFLPTQELFCQTSYYDKNQPNTTRTTSFGYGQRSSMISMQETPSPGQYDTDSPSKRKKGFTFGHNKKICFVDEQSKIFSKNPAPTKYEKAIFGKSFSFSFRSKYQDPLQRHKNVTFSLWQKLGPGQYNANDLITKRGFYSESKYKASCCRKIGKQKRFGGDQTPVPGPGKYKDQLGLDPVGTYYNSRIPSKGIRTFGKPHTTQLFRTDRNPGPGTYYHFPEFPEYLTARV